MRLRWTAGALSDLIRPHVFLEPVNERTAACAVQALVSTAEHLRDHPRVGRRLARYPGREIRRTLVGQHELRYEIVDDEIVILRLWHTRESR